MTHAHQNLEKYAGFNAALRGRVIRKSAPAGNAADFYFPPGNAGTQALWELELSIAESTLTSNGSAWVAGEVAFAERLRCAENGHPMGRNRTLGSTKRRLQER